MSQLQQSDGKYNQISINREIFRLCIPSIVSNVTIPLLGLCDTAIAGHLGSASYLAAIAVGAMMLNTIFWIFGFLRMGTTGMVAMAFGAEDKNVVRAVFSRAFMLAVTLGFILILLSEPLLKGLLLLIDPPEDVAGLASSYFRICIWEAPALLTTMVITGWFIGLQSTFCPMVIAIFINLANILLSLTAVFVLDYGFKGIAFATLIANWSGLCLALIVACKRAGGFNELWCNLSELLDFRDIGRFFKVNSNLFVRSACIIAVSLGVTALGARQGAVVLAVNTTMMQFFNFFSFFMDGFAFTGEALIGRFAGAKDKSNFKNAVSALLSWTFLIAILFTFAYRFGSLAIADILTDIPDVLSGFSDYNFWVVIIPLASCMAFIFDGFYIGLASTRDMLFSTLLGSIGFLSVNIFASPDFSFNLIKDNNYIWCGFIIYLFVRGLYLALRWKSVSGKALEFSNPQYS